MKEKLNLNDEQLDMIISKIKELGKDFKEIIVKEFKVAMVQITNNIIDALVEKLGVSQVWLNKELSH